MEQRKKGPGGVRMVRTSFEIGPNLYISFALRHILLRPTDLQNNKRIAVAHVSVAHTILTLRFSLFFQCKYPVLHS
jgi:hypothetical protein